MVEVPVVIRSGQLHLEGMWQEGSGPLGAVVLHPHPQYGGDMDNYVVIAMARGFAAADASYRSEFSSSATPSAYLNVAGYALANVRAGFRWGQGWMLSVWCRNVTDANYFELLSAQPGNSGLYVGLPGDPRTYGVTLRMALRK